VGGLTLPRWNPKWLPAAILKKSTWRHNSAEGGSILTKFGTSMQNETPMTKIRPKSKPEVVFQYGGRPFSETGSSFNSAVDWHISPKFGMQIDIHLLKRVQSRNLNPEVDFRLYGRHLEKSIWRITPPPIVRFWRNLAHTCKKTCRWLHVGRNRNRK